MIQNKASSSFVCVSVHNTACIYNYNIEEVNRDEIQDNKFLAGEICKNHKHVFVLDKKNRLLDKKVSHFIHSLFN